MTPNTSADVASLPANCRQRLMHEGKAYPRSGCAACGKWMPRAKECEAALAKPASGDGLPELPALPYPGLYARFVGYYTAEQMRAYGEQCRLATPEQPGLRKFVEGLACECGPDYSRGLCGRCAALSEQPGFRITSDEGGWTKEDALRYIENWCPDYVKDYIVSLEQPGSSVQGEVDEAAMEAWHSAVEEAGELYVNAPDSRYANRARRVKAWIVSHRPTPPPAPAAEQGGALASEPWCPNECPITRRPFFMWIEHPERGLVPTYGGPYDSYTLAERDDTDGTFMCERYDHDEGGWLIDQVEGIDLRLIDNQREDHEYGTVEALQQRIADLAAAPAAPGVRVDESLLLQAVARGWCSPENSHKVMDPALANAIVAEVVVALAPDGGEGPGRP